jgi:diguanylate cyclase (GGDEF)-like protein
MFAFGRSDRPRRRREPADLRKLEGSTWELGEALRHGLGILSSAVAFAGLDRALLTRIADIERDIERATLPEDFTAVSSAVRALDVRFTLPPEPEDAPRVDRSVLPSFVRGGRHVAEALGCVHACEALDLAADELERGDIARGSRRYGVEMALVTDAARFLRSAVDVLRSSVAELIDAMSPLASEESDSQRRLVTLRERIIATEDARELDGLRSQLVEAANALVEEANARGQRARDARERVARAAARVELLEAALDDARTMANTDALTGLPNRRGLAEAADRFARCASPTGVLAIDVDHFKRINDTWGHDVGDVVLRQIADVVRGELRGDDRAFRVGGEELLVLLADTDAGGARATAERLRRRVEQSRLAIGDHVVAVTVSVGVSGWAPREAMGAAVKRADRALYAAKRAGRNRVEAG